MKKIQSSQREDVLVVLFCVVPSLTPPLDMYIPFRNLSTLIERLERVLEFPADHLLKERVPCFCRCVRSQRIEP